MRALVTGAEGMLGQEMVATLRARGHEVVGLTRGGLDVTDPRMVDRVMERERPDVVVQCAAYTAVDQAEADEPLALAVNGTGAGHVARSCQRNGALFVLPSTDYVFAGTADRPYRPEDTPDPVNAYGRTKLAGEHEALEAGRSLVVRTSWLYGRGGRNFVDTIAGLAETRPWLEVVADQTGRPTWTGSLARGLAGLVESGATGIFHLTDAGPPVTWFGLAEMVVECLGLTTPVEPVATAAVPRPAARPTYSVLDCSKAEHVLQSELPCWRDTLSEYLRQRDRRV